jgi:hypothetical protein
MRRWVRALPMTLIGVFAVVATSTATEPAWALPDTGAGAAAPALASPPRPSTPDHSTRPTTAPTARGSTPMLQVAVAGESATSGPPRIEVALDPGASVQRSFVVTNRSPDLRVTVRFEAVDAMARSDGEVEYASTASSDGPASWLTLSDVVATIEPGASEHVSLTVEPPANAFPGSAVAGVIARVDGAVRADDGSAASAQASVSLPVAVKINGAATALVSVSGVGAIDDHGHQSLEITFENSGGTANVMVGQAQVLGPGGHSYAVRAAVAPLRRTTVRVPFAMPTGAKTASVSVATEDAAGDQADWSGAVGFGTPTASPTTASQASNRRGTAPAGTSATASLPRPALAVVVLVFAAAAIWFASELRNSRSRRRSIAVVPAVAGAYAAYAPVVADPLAAVVCQLGALVEAVDRLVTGVGGAPSTAAATSPPVPTTSPSPPSPTPTPEAVASAAVPAPRAPAAAPTPPSLPTAAPTAPPAPVVAPPAPATPAPSVTPVAKSPATELAEIARLLSMPAAPSVPELDEKDPYDWPSQEQLDQFADRRRESQNDPE